MNARTEVKKNKTSDVETPVHTIREGAISALIWQRQSPSGYAYFDYSLTRSYQSLSSGNASSSKNFFSRNRLELIKVIEEATEWINAHESPVEERQSIDACLVLGRTSQAA